MLMNEFLEFEPTESNEVFFIYDYFKRKKYKISNELFEFIIDLNLEEISEIDEESIKICYELGILIDPDEKYNEYLQLKEEWEKYGWREALKYHVATLDYPFRGERDMGIEVMLKYSKTEKDQLRKKSYSMIYKEYDLDEYDKEDLSSDFLTKGKLFLMLKYTLGYSNEINVQWTETKILQRTTPSGGSRQPTEGYFYVQDIKNLENGWYYINGLDNCLQKINNIEIDEKKMRELFPLVYSNTSMAIKAFVVLTSVFEKNMYRYREPRTFRTIHMDAGHISALMEKFAERYNYCSYVHYTSDENYILDNLNLNYLDEGFQTAVIFGEGGQN
ncbi:MAG: SagB/ThcOx family dehydrogenase [Paenisporosarcina sp.]